MPKPEYAFLIIYDYLTWRLMADQLMCQCVEGKVGLAGLGHRTYDSSWTDD